MEDLTEDIWSIPPCQIAVCTPISRLSC